MYEHVLLSQVMLKPEVLVCCCSATYTQVFSACVCFEAEFQLKNFHTGQPA